MCLAVLSTKCSLCVFEAKSLIIVSFFSTAKSSPGSPEPASLNVDVDHKKKRTVISNTVTTILTPLEKTSPCASNESLTVDHSR